MKAQLKSDRGIALVMVLAVMLILLSITGGALLLSGLNAKTASNVKTGGGAIHAADAGIQHALSTIAAGTTFSYSTSTASPSSVVPGTSFNGYTYTVTATNDAASTGGNSRAILISSATGPNSSNRKVRAYIGRSNTSWTPPGTVYIPGGSTSDADFNTSGTFFISGNDTSYSADGNNDGRADSTSAGPNPAIYGVAPLYDSMVTEFINSLSSSEKSKIQGLGYNASTSPVTPSVFKTSTSFSVTDLATNFKNQPGAAQHLSGMHLTTTNCPTPRPVTPSASCVFGTDAAPQITYIKADTSTIKFDPDTTVTGSGVLILDGKANIFGNFEFHGIVISLAAGPRGDESTEDKLKLKFKNNARLFGTLLLGPTGDDLKFDIKDNASIYYSSQALNLVQTLWGSLLPQPAKLLAWHEVMQ
ncbi:MAG: hypothetical protein HYU47_11255 [Deltaproteobacteria bacterium]|nr:hypothetical protein [Deltaproteobacteria bacterium]